MFNVYFYRDKNGNEPVAEHIKELSQKTSKDSRIKLNKILDYITVLQRLGKQAGEPYMKHLEGDIWELRPLRDRILFVGWKDNSFVLLHVFQKSTRKTPKKEIEKAQRELTDLKERGVEYE